jgi:DNA-binding MarR family transcriptional regulator
MTKEEWAKVRRDDAVRAAWQAMSDLVLDNGRRRRVSDRTGLSFNKLRALRRIAERSTSMRELAASLVVDPPNLTPVVDDLERAGLVERRPHPTDRRVKLVTATESGLALACDAQAMLDEPPLALAALGDDDLETLVRILGSLRATAPPAAEARS